MPLPRRSLFREQALQYHLGNRHKDVLPRFVSPPVFCFLWVLVALCLIGWWIAGSIHLPILTPGEGMVLTNRTSGETQIVLFVSFRQQKTVHPGEAVRLQIGVNGPSLLESVTAVAPTVVSPEVARQQYKLDGPMALLVTEPAEVIVVELTAGVLAPSYAGSIVHAQIQIGEQSLLSFIS